MPKRVLRRLTQSKGKHVGQRPGGVEDDVELACLEEQITSCCPRAICASEVAGKYKQTSGVGQAQDGSHDELSVLEANEGDNGLGKPGQQHGAYEGPGDGARKGEVVIGSGELVMDVGCWRPVDKHIVGGLDVEGFLDLGVGGNDEVGQDKSGCQEGKEGVWVAVNTDADKRINLHHLMYTI
jgi:hypothetical protein